MPIPELPQTDVPRYEAPASDWAHHLSGMCLRMRGWTMGGAAPRLDKYVLIAAPHTEWWDGFWMLCFSSWWGVRMNWLAKDSVMRWPVAGLLRRTGIVPVDRSAPQGLVGQIVEQFEKRERMVLAIPPEGTRGRREYWKSGFYHMAMQANVPICLSYLDFKTRVAGFGPCFDLTGDVRADMDRVREFYAGIEGKIPSNFTPPRLREEEGEGPSKDLPKKDLPEKDLPGRTFPKVMCGKGRSSEDLPEGNVREGKKQDLPALASPVISNAYALFESLECRRRDRLIEMSS